MRVVYTLPDTFDFYFQVKNSLKTLHRFVDRDEVTLIVNPKPRKTSKIWSLKRYAEIRPGDEFYKNLALPNFKYKIEICDIDADDLIFLDCDTLVLRDIRELLNDFDYSAREEPCFRYEGKIKPTWDNKAWKDALRHFNKPQDAIPINDGFLIIRHGIQKKIKDDFLAAYTLFHQKKLKSPNTVDDMHHNEFAISIALAGYKFKPMTEEHHWFGWRPEQPNVIPYVLHVGTDKRGLAGYKENLERCLRFIGDLYAV